MFAVQVALAVMKFYTGQFFGTAYIGSVFKKPQKTTRNVAYKAQVMITHGVHHCCVLAGFTSRSWRSAETS